MILAPVRRRPTGRKVLLVLLATAVLLGARYIVRDYMLRRACTDAGLTYEDGRCRPAPPPIILHRDLMRT